MRPIVADPGLVACCGLYCGACKSYLKEKCEGCRKSGKNSWCQVKKCAVEKGIATCADCGDFIDPMECKKFNNFIARMVGHVLNSDRSACIADIRRSGLQAYAEKMGGMGRQSIPKSE